MNDTNTTNGSVVQEGTVGSVLAALAICTTLAAIASGVELIKNTINKNKQVKTIDQKIFNQITDILQKDWMTSSLFKDPNYDDAVDPDNLDLDKWVDAKEREAFEDDEDEWNHAAWSNWSEDQDAFRENIIRLNEKISDLIESLQFALEHKSQFAQMFSSEYKKYLEDLSTFAKSLSGIRKREDGYDRYSKTEVEKYKSICEEFLNATTAFIEPIVNSKNEIKSKFHNVQEMSGSNCILDAINLVQESVETAEMDVLLSLSEAYSKSISIIENYQGDDYSSFELFQEGFKDDLNAPVTGNKGESIIKKILMFIPRLIAKIVRMINAIIFQKERWTDRKYGNHFMSRYLNAPFNTVNEASAYMKAKGIEPGKDLGGFKFDVVNLSKHDLRHFGYGSSGMALVVVCKGIRYKSCRTIGESLSNLWSSLQYLMSELHTGIKEIDYISTARYPSSTSYFFSTDFVDRLMAKYQTCVNDIKSDSNQFLLKSDGKNGWLSKHLPEISKELSEMSRIMQKQTFIDYCEKTPEFARNLGKIQSMMTGVSELILHIKKEIERYDQIIDKVTQLFAEDEQTTGSKIKDAARDIIHA